MKAAPVNLMEYFVTDLALSANPDFAPDKPIETKEGDFDVKIRQQRAPQAAEDHRWQVTVEIIHQAAKGTNFPYAFRVVMVGFFKAESWVSPDDEERTVQIQGASVLFSMAREIVRAMTGRGPHRPVILPTVSFYEQKASASRSVAASAADSEASQAMPTKHVRKTAVAKK